MRCAKANSGIHIVLWYVENYSGIIFFLLYVPIETFHYNLILLNSEQNMCENL
jgi:hypothetical protein